MSTAELQALTLAVLENQVAAYFDLASIAVLVYDYILSLKLEIGLVWGTPWNIGRILFVLTRYCVFVDSSLLAYFHFVGGQAVSARTCSLAYQISGWFIFWGGCLAEMVLVFRTWAIWGQNRKVAVGLCVLLVLIVLPLGYLTEVGLTSVEFAPSPIPHVQSCFIVANKDITILWDYVVILAFETVILVLTLIKGVQHYRHTTSSLVSTLYQDGVLYYIYLMALSIANVLFLAFVESKSGATLVLMQRVFHAILTSRILLHLRMAVVRDQRDASTGVTPQILTSMFSHSRRAEFSTAIIGTSTWVGEPESTGSDD